MRSLCAISVGRKIMWLAVVALVLSVPAPATAESAARDSSRQDGGSGKAFLPGGWSAGSVVTGTGYHQRDGSQRVREVQRRLNRLGYRAGRVDGLFGPITAAAVRAFQAARDLAVDGAVGRRTLRALRGQSVAAPIQRDVPRRDTSQRETERRPAPIAQAEDEEVLWTALLFVVALIAITALLASTLGRLRGPGRPRWSVATRSAPHANGRAVSGRWIGARIHLVGARGPGPEIVYVEPELFAKSTDGSQETTLARDRGRPLAIATDDFEASLRDVFASEWLPRLDQALRTEGIEVSSRELQSMPLVVELTADLRQTLATHRWSPAAEERGSDDA